MPWPWGPAEEYLEEYEQYLIGFTRDEPALPEGLSEQDKELIAAQVDFLNFRAENGFCGYTDDALGMYDALQEIKDLPEAADGD